MTRLFNFFILNCVVHVISNLLTKNTDHCKYVANGYNSIIYSIKSRFQQTTEFIHTCNDHQFFILIPNFLCAVYLTYSAVVMTSFLNTRARAHARAHIHTLNIFWLLTVILVLYQVTNQPVKYNYGIVYKIIK